MSEQETRRIGDYEILAVLGSGGMGQVFKVRNVISDRIEAMKIILPDLAGRQDLADRFLREIKLLAGLDHPNIAALRTALTVNNQLLMIMEYVEGKTLAQCVESGPIAIPDAVNYMDQVLGALSYAHQRNIIHRDIKPSNMMLTPAGVVKLMDFGIARSDNDTGLTATGAALGSLYYMSPEQVKGQPVDARSDLYSVGASLYELVTGQHPFKADSSYSLMAAQVQQSPKPPIEIREGLPAALNEIILLAMAKEPGQRFQSADAFRNALKHSGVAAASVSVPAVAATSAGQTAQAAALAATMTSLPPKPVPTTGAAAATMTALPLPADPLPAPSVIEMSQRTRSHQGLYMALGGLLVVAFLVAAGIYIPRRDKARAGDQTIRTQEPASSSGVPADANGQPSASAAPATPVPPSSATTGDAAAVSQNSAAATTSGSGMSGGGDAGAGTPAAGNNFQSTDAGVRKTSAKSSAAGRHAVQETMGMPSGMGSAPPDNSAALDELEQQIDHLSSREAAVNDSLDNLKRQQAAQGLGLRGDIAAAQERVKIHVDKAQQALQARDVEHAKKYADQAEADLATLEKFLGR